ncbi:MAG: polysaccharide deacetylase family protein [Bacillota bacterium]
MGTAPRLGSKGPHILDLQRRLSKAGFSPGPLDGIFGKKTLEAVRAFQEDRGLSVTGLIDETTARALGILPQVGPAEVLRRVDRRDGRVALTFDDGPDHRYSLKIANALAEGGARGTFFFLGSMLESAKLDLSSVCRLGHEPASHGYSHTSFRALPFAAMEQELVKTEDAIIRHCGIRPRFFRPPYGAFDSRVILAARKRGYPFLALWDVDTRDWTRPGVSRIIASVERNASSGSIILLHEGYESTLQALSGILRALKNKGLRSVTLSELINGHSG